MNWLTGAEVNRKSHARICRDPMLIRKAIMPESEANNLLEGILLTEPQQFYFTALKFTQRRVAR
jgi:hypothetical protein